MARVITYSNTSITCYTTVELDNGDNIFVSIAGSPSPSIRVQKTRLIGILKTMLWEFTPHMAGGYEAYVRKMVRAFADPNKPPQHPLDGISDLIMTCRSAEEVVHKLFAAERRMKTPLPDEDVDGASDGALLRQEPPEQSPQPAEPLVVRIDTRGPGPVGDCFDCFVAFQIATQRMRSQADESAIPAATIAHTRAAFAKLDAKRADLCIVAMGGQDHLYHQVAQLSILDRYTRAYVAQAVRDFFEQLRTRSLSTYYVLDNNLRDDRFQAVVELFEVAGISVVSPRLHGADWATLSARLRSFLGAGSHVAYIEPDAAVNHIGPAQRLAEEFACVATFRNRAPEDPHLSVLTLPKAQA